MISQQNPQNRKENQNEGQEKPQKTRTRLFLFVGRIFEFLTSLVGA